MSTSPDRKPALLALSRFGYGARGHTNDLVRVASDPRGLLKAELEQPGNARLDGPGLPSSKDALHAVFAEQRRILAAREGQAANPAEPENKAPAMDATVAPEVAPKADAAKAEAAEPSPSPQQRESSRC